MTDLIIYNSMAQKKEVFKPLEPGRVKMYVCGPTVYDRIHIGNARPFVVFDVFYRLLSHDYKVTYVRNLTDVDDKINKRATELGCQIRELTEKTTQYFHEDIGQLNVLEPDVEPRATDHIKQMIAMILELIEKGHAYEAEGHVLFRVDSLASYGCLSKRTVDDMIAGARVEVAPYKENPADFVLWKPSDDETPGWGSPWGFGRPGWHIECSAMSLTYLGETFDIHGGGRDLIFPHHENEVAQSVGCHGEGTFARYWMHNGMLTVDGQKMSKSLGNFITLHEALQNHHPETVRFFLMASHYRKSLDWTEGHLSQAKSNLDRLYTALRDHPSIGDGSIDDQVMAALRDDLNTPLALARLHELAGQVNRGECNSNTLFASGHFMGLFHEGIHAWFTWQSPKDKEKNDISDSEIESLIKERNVARANKDFSRADQIRDQLQTLDIILEDAGAETTWRRG